MGRFGRLYETKAGKAREYHEEGAYRKGGWVDETDYLAHITHFPGVCVDAVPVSSAGDEGRGMIYFPIRVIEPGRGPGTMGGAVRYGESLPEAMVRHFRDDTRNSPKETGLVLESSRFMRVAEHRYHLATRAQEPRNIGRDDLTHVHLVELTNEEITYINNHINQQEYDPRGLVPYTRLDIAKHETAGTLPPYLLDIAFDYFEQIDRTRRRWQLFEKICRRVSADEVLVELATELGLTV